MRLTCSLSTTIHHTAIDIREKKSRRGRNSIRFRGFYLDNKWTRDRSVSLEKLSSKRIFSLFNGRATDYSFAILHQIGLSVCPSSTLLCDTLMHPTDHLITIIHPKDVRCFFFISFGIRETKFLFITGLMSYSSVIESFTWLMSDWQKKKLINNNTHFVFSAHWWVGVRRFLWFLFLA